MAHLVVGQSQDKMVDDQLGEHGGSRPIPGKLPGPARSDHPDWVSWLDYTTGWGLHWTPRWSRYLFYRGSFGTSREHPRAGRTGLEPRHLQGQYLEVRAVSAAWGCGSLQTDPTKTCEKTDVQRQ